MRHFRKLEVWQQSVQSVTKVYQISSQLPDTEKYSPIVVCRDGKVDIIIRNFVVTAYITDKIKKGDEVWIRIS